MKNLRSELKIERMANDAPNRGWPSTLPKAPPSYEPLLAKRLHGAWYLVPGLMLVASPIGAVLAALMWLDVHVVQSMRDVTEYGDGNPVPPHHRDDHQGSIDMLLLMAGMLAVASVVGFVAIAIARHRSWNHHPRG